MPACHSACTELQYARFAHSSDRWVISNFGKPGSLPAAAIQGAVNDLIEGTYPRWDHYAKFVLHGLLLRHDVSAEELGLVPPLSLSETQTRTYR